MVADVQAFSMANWIASCMIVRRRPQRFVLVSRSGHQTHVRVRFFLAGIDPADVDAALHPLNVIALVWWI